MASIADTDAVVGPASKANLSATEYLAFERTADVKHEYADGEIYAMSGGTFEHSATAANLIAELRVGLRTGNCQPLTSDMRVKIPASGRYVYPDGSVVCGEPQFEDDARDTLLNPTVVIEVVSDSSEAYDRGEKFAQYQTVASVKEYVIASQKSARIEVFTRQTDGGWLLHAYEAGQRATLRSVDCEIAVDSVYRGVIAQRGA